MSIEKFREAHTTPDTDQSAKAIHHTLGPGPNQAAPGSLVKRVKALEEGGSGGPPVGGLFKGNWEDGSYLKNDLVIYEGSLYTAKEDTNEPPLTLIPITGPVINSPPWNHNNIVGIDSTEQSLELYNGTFVSNIGSAIIYPHLSESSIVGGTLEAECYSQSSSIAYVNQGIYLGIIEGSKSIFTTNLFEAGSGFTGIRISKNNIYTVSNGVSSSSILSESNIGQSGWATFKIKILSLDENNARVHVFKNGTKISEGTVSIININSWRVALGVWSGASTGSPTYLAKLRGTPTVGAQSSKWRRISAIADLV